MTSNSKNESHTDKFWHRMVMKENAFIIIENKKLVCQGNY